MKVMAAGHRYWPEFPRRSLAVGLFARFQHGGRTARRAVGIASENNPSHKRCSMLKSPSEWFVGHSYKALIPKVEDLVVGLKRHSKKLQAHVRSHRD